MKDLMLSWLGLYGLGAAAILLAVVAIVAFVGWTCHKNGGKSSRWVTVKKRIVAGVIAVAAIIVSIGTAFASVGNRDNYVAAKAAYDEARGNDGEVLAGEPSTEAEPVYSDGNVTLPSAPTELADEDTEGADVAEETDLTEEEGDGEHLPELDFNKIQYKARFAYYITRNFVSYEAMELMAWLRTDLTSYSDAAGFPMNFDPVWAEEKIGLIRDGESAARLEDNLPPELTPERQRELKKLFEKKAKKLAKEYSEMTPEEQQSFDEERLYFKIFTDIPFLASCLELFSSDDYFMRNNAVWITEDYGYVVSVQDMEGDISNLTEYAEGHKDDPAYLKTVARLVKVSIHVAAVFDYAQYVGTVKADSERNWHHDDTAAVGPNWLVENDEQEQSKKWVAWDFGITKTNSSTTKRIGLNKEDTRLGVLALKKAKNRGNGGGGGGEKEAPPKTGTVVVGFVEEGTGEVLHSPDTRADRAAGTSEPFSAEDIAGYSLCGQSKGSGGSMNVTVVAGRTVYEYFYYRKNSSGPGTGTVVGKHVDVDTGKRIQSFDDTVTVTVGKSGEVSALKNPPDGYEFVRNSVNNSSSVSVKIESAGQKKVVTFYYKKAVGYVQVNYLKWGTNEVLKTEAPHEVKVGKSHTANAPNDINGNVFYCSDYEGKNYGKTVTAKVTKKGQTKVISFYYKSGGGTTTTEEKSYDIYRTVKYSSGTVIEDRNKVATKKKGEHYDVSVASKKGFKLSYSMSPTGYMPGNDLHIVAIYTPEKPDGEGSKDSSADPERQPSTDRGPGDNNDPTPGKETNISDEKTGNENRVESDKKSEQAEEEEKKNDTKREESIGNATPETTVQDSNPDNDSLADEKKTGTAEKEKVETTTKPDGSTTTTVTKTEIDTGTLESTEAVTDDD